MDELRTRIPPQIFTKLIDAQYDSLKTIMLTDENLIQQNAQLSSKQVEKLLEIVAEILLTNKIKTALEVSDWHRLSTGCNVIDSMMRGGIPVNGITEICGNSGVGKTQFCLQLLLTVQLPESLGGFEKGAVYISTEDLFPSKRLRQLSELCSYRLNFEDNIYIEHISDFEQLRRFLYVRLPHLLSTTKIGLIIIDSIAGAFRSNNEKVNYAVRKEEFVTISSKLNEISDEFGIAVLCTNQVTDNLQTGETEPALGLAWSNIVTSRFRITRNFHSPVRYFHVIFSPNLPNDICKFVIKDIGLVGSE